MELKKSQDANNEKLKLPVASMGFLFVTGLVLASFTYLTPLEREQLEAVENRKNADAIEEIVVEEEIEEPEQQETVQLETPPPQEEIIIEENKPDPPKSTPAVPPPKPPAKKDKPAEEKIIEFPDVDAGFPGGYAAMSKFINENIVYPEISMDMGDQGKVYVSFVVEKDGSITGVTIAKKVTAELDREAKRVVRSMPAWKPGEAGGLAVRTKVSLPITFKIN